MDPKFSSQETYQCQICQIYVSKQSQQVHDAACAQRKNSGNKNIQNKISFNFNNNIQQPQVNFNIQNQESQSQIQFITKKNQQGILNNQNQGKIKQQQYFPTPIKNQQFQDKQVISNQQFQQSFNEQGQSFIGQFQSQRQFQIDPLQSNVEIKQEQFNFNQNPPKTVLPQQFPQKSQILLNQQLQFSNASQLKNEQTFNQNINNQQLQQGIFKPAQNQQGDQDQIQQAQNQNQIFGNMSQFKNNFNRQQFPKPMQQNYTQIQNSGVNQQKIFQPNQPQKQQQPQMFLQQQQQNTSNNIPLLQQNQFRVPLFQTETVNQSNIMPAPNQNISVSQPIQGLPRQFPAPRIPQIVQPNPFSQQVQHTLVNSQSDEDDDDDDGDDDEYGFQQFLISGRGIQNFDVNKKYTDQEVNRMNQEQIYQYFSNLLINEDHGYTEDQINNKLQQNFQINNGDNIIDICVICQESFTQETFTTDKQLPCFHIFHLDCLQGWLKRSKHCPVCKTLVEL